MLKSGSKITICMILTIEISWFSAADSSIFKTRLLDITTMVVALVPAADSNSAFVSVVPY
jgi:hypothetical protein